MPRKAFRDATARIEPFATRDEIERTANHLRTVSEIAYFYAGLAFGMTFLQFGAGRWHRSRMATTGHRRRR